MPRPRSDIPKTRRTLRLCVEQDAALHDLAVRTNKPVQKLIREAIEAFTHVPDALGTQSHQRKT